MAEFEYHVGTAALGCPAERSSAGFSLALLKSLGGISSADDA
jgi:hypothetical protein